MDVGVFCGIDVLVGIPVALGAIVGRSIGEPFT